MQDDSASDLQIFAVRDLPEIVYGDKLSDLLMNAISLHPFDVVVISQKLVSKAEGRVETLAANDNAAKRALVLREASRVLRERDGMLITETTQGFVCANSGIDESNVDEATVSLLPLDSDRSARKIHDALVANGVAPVGVLISDTFGRAWRHGVTDVAIGIAGLQPVLDLRGRPDANGRTLHVTEVCIADELTGAAELVRRKDGRIGAAVIRGVDRAWFLRADVSAKLVAHRSIRNDVVRASSLDLFR